MTATMNDLMDDSLSRLPRPAPRPAAGGYVPVLTVTVNDQAVLTVARRLHDATCLHGQECELRDFHALDRYEADVQNMLTALVEAGRAADSPEISTCRVAIEHRWLRGQWWCKQCGSGVKFRAGHGWVHIG